MKKLILIGLLALMLTSCGVDIVTTDPLLKESERIALLEKAKTDTLTTIVELDDKYYIIKDSKIQGSFERESSDIGFSMLLSAWVCLLIAFLVFKD